MDQKLPHHVAIVMDGNGRWAENRGLMRVEGHRAGVQTVKKIVQTCLEKKIAILSLFAFSSENWSRPEMEVDFLMQLFIKSLQNEINTLHEHGVSLRFTGDRNALSENLRIQMHKAEVLTEHNKKLILNIAVNYSGKWDILQALGQLIEKFQDKKFLNDKIDEQMIASFLATKGLPDPDLFIRTSGEQRISNFFLWQLAYTELYFSDLHWPDFTSEEFLKALNEFSKRERRYGRISEQLQFKEKKTC